MEYSSLVQFNIWTIISIVISILAILLYKHKSLCYGIINLSIFQKDSIEIVSIINLTIESETVEDLSISIIKIWNGGNKAIIKNDYATSDIIRIRINPIYKIYKYDIIIGDKENYGQVVSTFDEEHQQIIINFHHFGKDDSILFKILHSGSSSKDISVLSRGIDIGTIKKKTLIYTKINPVYYGIMFGFLFSFSISYVFHRALDFLNYEGLQYEIPMFLATMIVLLLMGMSIFNRILFHSFLIEEKNQHDK